MIDGLPSLAAGAHDAGDGEACVMEYVALLAGEPWSDRPDCTHPVLAHEARTANDLLLDHDRGRLVPLVGRLFGTAEDSTEIRARLRLAQAGQVLALVPREARHRASAVAERAERLLLDPAADEAEVDAARTVAVGFAVEAGDLDPEHVAVHVGAARIFAFAAGPDTGGAEAWALAALVAAHRVAAGECRADCGDGAARARRMVRDLAGLIDVYDDATGRDPVSPTPRLIAELGAAAAR